MRNWWGKGRERWQRPAIVQMVDSAKAWLGGLFVGIVVLGLYQARLADLHPSWSGQRVWAEASVIGVGVAALVALAIAPYKQRNDARNAYDELAKEPSVVAGAVPDTAAAMGAYIKELTICGVDPSSWTPDPGICPGEGGPRWVVQRSIPRSSVVKRSSCSAARSVLGLR